MTLQTEKQYLTIGYMPLTDCLPLIIAKENGFFDQQGLCVTLHRQNSWATLRDKLHTGFLDAAHMLAPMAVASHLGLGTQVTPIKVPAVLSYFGNGITLSVELFKVIRSQRHLASGQLLKTAVSGNDIREVFTHKRKGKSKKRVFATVFHFSNHYYQLRSWLGEAAGPGGDSSIIVMPPTDMVPALRSGDIDGFCVGSPWNALAVRQQTGVTVATSNDLWPCVPEKVLGITADWQQQHPNTTQALVNAIQQAAHWLTAVPNRFEAARLLSQESYLNVPLDVVAPALLDSCLTHHNETPREVPGYIGFSDESSQAGSADSIRTVIQGEWLIQQMINAGHIPGNIPVSKIAADIFSF